MMKVPMLGIVENMSYIVCPDCGKHINVFGESMWMRWLQSTACPCWPSVPSIPSWLRFPMPV